MSSELPPKTTRTRRALGARSTFLDKPSTVVGPLIKKPGNPGHGGAGKGQGRPAGSKNKPKTEATILNMSIREDILRGQRVIKEAGDELPENATPLDVMIMAMRSAYKLGGSLMAFPYAEKAAPYLHARIAQIQLADPNKDTGEVKFGWLTDDDPKKKVIDAVDATLLNG